MLARGEKRVGSNRGRKNRRSSDPRHGAEWPRPGGGGGDHRDGRGAAAVTRPLARGGGGSGTARHRRVVARLEPREGDRPGADCDHRGRWRWPGRTFRGDGIAGGVGSGDGRQPVGHRRGPRRREAQCRRRCRQRRAAGGNPRSWHRRAVSGRRRSGFRRARQGPRLLSHGIRAVSSRCRVGCSDAAHGQDRERGRVARTALSGCQR